MTAEVPLTVTKFQHPRALDAIRILRATRPCNYANFTSARLPSFGFYFLPQIPLVSVNCDNKAMLPFRPLSLAMEPGRSAPAALPLRMHCRWIPLGFLMADRPGVAPRVLGLSHARGMQARVRDITHIHHRRACASAALARARHDPRPRARPWATVLRLGPCAFFAQCNKFNQAGRAGAAA